MNRRNLLGMSLVVLAAVLFIVPALFPVQPMLTHDTRDSVPAPEARLEEEGFRVIEYGNLSDRGQELYRRTLENNGEYHVSQGRGAPEFEYPTVEELADARDDRQQSARADREQTRLGEVVIERPEDDSGLPEADEHFFGPREREDGNESVNETKRREQAMRYDLMGTRTEQPPLGATPQLIRLAAALLAVVSLGVGGYLLSSK